MAAPLFLVLFLSRIKCARHWRQSQIDWRQPALRPLAALRFQNDQGKDGYFETGREGILVSVGLLWPPSGQPEVTCNCWMTRHPLELSEKCQRPHIIFFCCCHMHLTSKIKKNALLFCATSVTPALLHVLQQMGISESLEA